MLIIPLLQPEEAQKRGQRQLLDALEAGQASTAYGLGPAGQQAALPGSPTPMPPGFLDDLHAHMASQEQEAEWMALLSNICELGVGREAERVGSTSFQRACASLCWVD